MPNRICICCGGRLVGPSPRNPNICLNCEQLLEDDCAELNRLMAGIEEPGPVHRVVPDRHLGEGTVEIREPVSTPLAWSR